MTRITRMEKLEPDDWGKEIHPTDGDHSRGTHLLIRAIRVIRGFPSRIWLHAASSMCGGVAGFHGLSAKPDASMSRASDSQNAHSAATSSRK